MQLSFNIVHIFMILLPTQSNLAFLKPKTNLLTRIDILTLADFAKWPQTN